MSNTQRNLHKKLLGRKGEKLAVKFVMTVLFYLDQLLMIVVEPMMLVMLFLIMKILLLGKQKHRINKKEVRYHGI